MKNAITIRMGWGLMMSVALGWASASPAEWVQKDMGDSANSTLFGVARISAGHSGYTGVGFIERLYYNLKSGGFSTEAPCDYTGIKIRYAADGAASIAVKVQTDSSPMIDWDNTPKTSFPNTWGWSKWSVKELDYSGSQGKYLHLRGYWKDTFGGINVDYVEWNKATYAAPGSVTFGTPTFGQSQLLSWGAVSNAINGYEIQVKRGGGSWTSFATVGSGRTSTNIPPGEFEAMGTRQFRVRARTSTRRNADDWAATATQTVQKAEQAAVSGAISPATIAYGGRAVLTASGGTGAGAYEFRQNGGTGTVGFSGGGNARTVTVVQAGTAILQIRRLGDANYNDSDWSSGTTLTILKTNQSTLTLSPTTVQTSGTTRSYTAGGGDGGGAIGDTLASGSATRTGALTYRADSGTGSYVIRLVKAADANYNARTNEFSIPLAKAAPSALSLSPTNAHTFGESRTFTVGGGSGGGAVSDALASGSATRTGVLTYEATAGSGSYVVRIVKAADSDYLGQTNTFTITLTKAAQAAPASIVSQNPTYGSSVSLGWTSVASAANGYRIEMRVDSGDFAFLADSAAGAASTSLTVAASSFDSMGARRYRVRARETETHHEGSWRESAQFTVQKAEQGAASGVLGHASIAFDATTTVTASGGTGTGAYDFRQNGGTGGVGFSGTGSARTITPTQAGTAAIEVRRLGDANSLDSAWAAAGTLTITKINQVALTLTPTTSHTCGVARTFTPGGGSGSGAYSDALLGGPATRTAAWNYLANSGTGSYTVRVVRAADVNYHAQTNAFAVPLAKKVQTVTFPGGAWTNKTYGGAPFALSASASSGLPVTYASLDAAVATVTGNQVTIVGAGTVVLRASQAGNGDFAAAFADRTLVVAKRSQAALTLSPTNAHRNTTTRRYTAGGGSGTGAVSDSLVSGDATRTGEWTYQATADQGSYVLRIVKAADGNHLAQTNEFTIPLEAFRAIRYPGLEWETMEGVRRR